MATHRSEGARDLEPGSAPASPGCPSLAVLEQIAGGTPPGLWDGHLAGCAGCRARIGSIRADNELLEGVAAAHRPAPGDDLAEHLAGDIRPPQGYEILSMLYSGGQGVVYRAVQRSTRRHVALKMLRDGALATLRQRDRFEREIELIAGLRHPNIVTVFDSGVTPGGRPYFAMEFVDGTRLDEFAWPAAERPRDGFRRPIRPVVLLFVKLCAAVDHAHRLGIIHRDLKPGNVLVDPRAEPRVLDFGLAKAIGTSIRAPTETGDFVGTWAYASPEQVALGATAVQTASDAYSLGVMLYEALVERPPYATDGSMREIVRQITEAVPTPPNRIRCTIPGDLSSIVLRALSKDPRLRYPTAGALGDELRRFLDGEAVQAHRDSNLYVFRKAIARHRGAFLVIAGGVAALAAFAIVLAIQLERKRDALHLAYEHSADADAAIATLIRTISSADPVHGATPTTTPRELLDSWARAMGDPEALRPGARAPVWGAIGRTYFELGDVATGRQWLVRALEASAGRNDAARARNLVSMALCDGMPNLTSLDEPVEILKQHPTRSSTWRGGSRCDRGCTARRAFLRRGASMTRRPQ